MVYAYSKEQGVNIELCNNGDDCQVFMEASDVDKFRENLTQWFYEMGFNMKVEPTVYTFEKVEFCQTKPVFDGTKWIMVRRLVALTKDTYCINNLNHPEHFKKWVSAVGMGGLKAYGGIPIYNSFYRSMILTEDVGKVEKHPQMQTGGLYWLSQGLDRRDQASCSDEARLSFWRAFGVTPDAQLLAEEYYTAHPPCYSPMELHRPVTNWPVPCDPALLE
jgi:hypothetical protein